MFPVSALCALGLRAGRPRLRLGFVLGETLGWVKGDAADHTAGAVTTVSGFCNISV